mmetsp:Transcript_15407/g.62010  ORF Transcript_15407/g.62010 Transcript_15407/m.62010 type:complete len:228 (+) Transcript_15407:2772-3455(+)
MDFFVRHHPTQYSPTSSQVGLAAFPVGVAVVPAELLARRDVAARVEAQHAARPALLAFVDGEARRASRRVVHEARGVRARGDAGVDEGRRRQPRREDAVEFEAVVGAARRAVPCDEGRLVERFAEVVHDERPARDASQSEESEPGPGRRPHLEIKIQLERRRRREPWNCARAEIRQAEQRREEHDAHVAQHLRFETGGRRDRGDARSKPGAPDEPPRLEALRTMSGR